MIIIGTSVTVGQVICRNRRIYAKGFEADRPYRFEMYHVPHRRLTIRLVKSIVPEFKSRNSVLEGLDG